MPGKFVTFEGGEGCGKTTQLRRLLKLALEVGIDAVATREPGGTALGGQLREVLLEAKHDRPIVDRAELLLFAADRAQHIDEFILPHLERGALVLCDRYVDSTIAYQGYGRGLDRDTIDRLNYIATGGLESDLTIWLDVSPDIGLARTRDRGKINRIEREDIEFFDRVREGYAKLAQTHGDRIVRVESTGAIDAVAGQIWQIFKERAIV